MEYIISKKALADEISSNVALFCETKQEYFWQHIDMTKFVAGSQEIQCPCHRESFIISVRTIIDSHKKKEGPF
jgi:hypothetical protein